MYTVRRFWWGIYAKTEIISSQSGDYNQLGTISIRVWDTLSGLHHSSQKRHSGKCFECDRMIARLLHRCQVENVMFPSLIPDRAHGDCSQNPERSSKFQEFWEIIRSLPRPEPSASLWEKSIGLLRIWKKDLRFLSRTRKPPPTQQEMERLITVS